MGGHLLQYVATALGVEIVLLGSAATLAAATEVTLAAGLSYLRAQPAPA